jgi:hypothetical protein
LKVHGILGTEVATVVDEEKPAVDYEVEFEGNNLSNGIYFCEIITTHFTDTKKMLPLKLRIIFWEV